MFLNKNYKQTFQLEHHNNIIYDNSNHSCNLLFLLPNLFFYAIMKKQECKADKFAKTIQHTLLSCMTEPLSSYNVLPVNLTANNCSRLDVLWIAYKRSLTSISLARFDIIFDNSTLKKIRVVMIYKKTFTFQF